MKKLFRIIISTIVLTAILAHTVIFALSETVGATNKQKAITVLLNSGWTEDEIEYFLTDDIILSYKDVKNLVSSDKSFYKVTDDGMMQITENECTEALISMSATNLPIGGEITDPIETSDGYLSMCLRVYNMGSGIYRATMEYEWLKDPANTKTDVIALYCSDELVFAGRDTVSYLYRAERVLSDNSVIENIVITQPETIESNTYGVVVHQTLASSQTGLISTGTTNHRGYLQAEFEVDNSSALVGAIAGEYIHQQYLWTVTPQITFGDFDISATPSLAFKEMSPNPYLTFNIG